MTLDGKILDEAKSEFGMKYAPLIAGLGYTLSYGLTKNEGEFTIAAIVQSHNEVPEDKVKEIRELIPTEFQYKKEKVPVELSYRPIGRLY
jgi:hypothetical protein